MFFDGSTLSQQKEINRMADVSREGLIVLFVLIILVLIALKIFKYIIDYANDIKYIKMEIRRSFGGGEERYWRRELSNVRWCIIPFMTPDRVKRIRRNFKKR